MQHNYIAPNWPAPKNIRAYVTTRNAGNLASNVGDDLSLVLQNRRKLSEALQLPSEPYWLKQTHTNKAVTVDHAYPEIIADASYTNKPDQICAVLTADCLPLLICDKSGERVAAIHAGWKGLATNIIENTLPAMNVHHLNYHDFLVWLGPAIGPDAFLVGEDVREAFIQQNSSAISAFTQKENDHSKWNCNIYSLAKQCLNRCGIPNSHIYGEDFCTFSQANQFFSFRRDQGFTGRMASLIWKSAAP